MGLIIVLSAPAVTLYKVILLINVILYCAALGTIVGRFHFQVNQVDILILFSKLAAIEQSV